MKKLAVLFICVGLLITSEYKPDFIFKIHDVPPTIPRKTFDSYQKFKELGFNLESISHKNDMLDSEETIEIILQGNPKSKLKPFLTSKNGKKLKKRIFYKSDFGFHSFLVSFPKKGKYFLTIKGKMKGEKKYKALLSYEINASRGISKRTFIKKILDIEKNPTFAAGGTFGFEGISEEEYKKMSNAKPEGDLYKMLINNPDVKKSVDIVILGDGYTKEDHVPGGEYEQHAIKFIEGFFKGAPFKKYKKNFNVYRVKCISKERGGSKPGKKIVNNLFGSSYGAYGIDRLLVPKKKNKIIEYVKKAPDFDMAIIMVNDQKYGGAGNSVYMRENRSYRLVPAPVYSAGSHSSVKIALHELGHSYGGLSDEYVQDSIANKYPISGARRALNVDTTKDLNQIKWKKFFDYPGAKKKIGAYEGAYYRSKGVFRPQINCIMRSLSYQFCHICKKEMTKKIFSTIGKEFDEHAYHLENPIEGKAVIIKKDDNEIVEVKSYEKAIEVEFKRLSASKKDVKSVSTVQKNQGFFAKEIMIKTGEALIVYNEKENKAYTVPWWNYRYLKFNKAFKKVGVPKGQYFYKRDVGWVQVFEKGELVLPENSNDINRIVFKPFVLETTTRVIKMFTFKNSTLKKTSQKNWLQRSGKNVYIFNEQKKDKRFIYLQDLTRNIYIAIPRNKKTKFFWIYEKINNKYKWNVKYELPE